MANAISPRTVLNEGAPPIPGFSRSAWGALAQRGLFSLFAAAHDDAVRAGLPNLVNEFIRLGEAEGSLGLAFSAGAHLFAVMNVVRKFAPAACRSGWLTEMASGECVGAIAVAEPTGGSDAFALETIARATPGGYIVSGRKRSITNATAFGRLLVFARESVQDRIICLAVEAGTPGLKVNPATDIVGLSDSGVGDIELVDCWVPDAHVLGLGERAKWAFMHAMEWERGLILAPAVGRMRRQVLECARWLRARQRGGVSALDHQVVRHRLAKMSQRLEHSELVLDRFVSMKLLRKSAFAEASSVKLTVSESFVENSLDAVSLYGSWGYRTACPAQLDLGDAMGFLAASGPNDVQRDIIANAVIRSSACH